MTYPRWWNAFAFAALCLVTLLCAKAVIALLRAKGLL